MSEIVYGYGQMLSVAVIVGGVAIALWQVWVLANKLCKNRDREAVAAPTESDLHGIERAARERILAGTSGRTPPSTPRR